MKGYLARKIIYVVIILYTIASLNFVIFQIISPTSPETAFANNPQITVEHREKMLELWGLDKPLSERYITYVINMFTFNFGISFTTSAPVIYEMLPRLRNTLLLLGLSLLFNIMVGIPVGILAASKRGTKIDAFVMGVGLFTWGAPIFFIQLVFKFFFANPDLPFYFFPPGKMTFTPPPTDPLAYITDVAYHLILPLITLVVAQFGWWALYSRNMMIDSLTEDYIVTARAKGINERKVLYKHAFKPTLPPIVTMVALIIPSLFIGAIVTEYIFAWPGTGQWFLQSIEKADFPAAQALLWLYTVMTVGANFLVDLIYGFLDPRIRVGVRR